MAVSTRAFEYMSVATKQYRLTVQFVWRILAKPGGSVWMLGIDKGYECTRGAVVMMLLMMYPRFPLPDAIILARAIL